MKALWLMLGFMMILIIPSTSFAQMGQDDLDPFRNHSSISSDIFDDKQLDFLGSRVITQGEKNSNQLTLTLPSGTTGQLFVLSPSGTLCTATTTNGGQNTVNIDTSETGEFLYVFVTNTTVYLGIVVNT